MRLGCQRHEGCSCRKVCSRDDEINVEFHCIIDSGSNDNDKKIMDVDYFVR
jgi:hypothetical protein